MRRVAGGVEGNSGWGKTPKNRIGRTRSQRNNCADEFKISNPHMIFTKWGC